MAKVFHHALPDGAVVDHYEIRGVLGAGGFSITYLGWDERLACKVAIKEFLPSDLAIRKADGSTVIPRTSEDQESYLFGLERFLKEARVLARFKEPNIVRVSNFLEANGTAYMIMDYEDGEALSEFLKRENTLGEGEVKAIVIPILESLRAVHQQDFLHRDIKPGNIYLRRDGRPVLIDFGAARQALGEHSKSMTSIVTSGYAPFEQYSWRGKQGPWTDIYALGATMYRCVTGESPLESTERTAAMTEGEPDPLKPVRESCKGDYSQEFLDTIDWMLAPAAKDRPQDVDVVIERLMTTGATPVIPAGFGSSAEGEGAGSDREPMSGLSRTRFGAASQPASAPRPSGADKQGSAAGKAVAAVVVLLILVGGGYGIYRYLQPESAPVVSSEEEQQVKPMPEPAVIAKTPEPVAPVVQPEPELPVVEAPPVPTTAQPEVVEVAPPPSPVQPVEPEPAPEPVVVQPPPPSPASQPDRVTRGRIAGLLERAEASLAALRLTSPPGDNAVEQFNEVLRLDPGNAAAKSGLHQVVDKYVDLTKAAINNRQFDRARRHLERAEAIEPASQELMILGEQIASSELAARRQQEDQERLARAQAQVAPEPAKPTAPSVQVADYPEMVKVKGGCFQMGSPATEASRQADEHQHKVCVDDFQLGRYEVSVGQFRKFVDATHYRTDAEKDKGCRVWKGSWIYEAGLTWQSRKITKDDTHPVICVSWRDATAYTDWLSRTQGGKYRLPTEAEWEYAARAGTTGARFWGDDDRIACAYANVGDAGHFKGNMFNCDDGYRYTAPIGSYAPNKFGVNDLLGNVWEWTCSAHDSGYGGGERRCLEEPGVMETQILGTQRSLNYRDAARVARGGSWTSEPRFVRAANRNPYAPSDRYIHLGFRVARD